MLHEEADGRAGFEPADLPMYSHGHSLFMKENHSDKDGETTLREQVRRVWIFHHFAEAKAGFAPARLAASDPYVVPRAFAVKNWMVN